MSLIQNNLKIAAQVSAFLEKEYMQYHTHAKLASDFFVTERRLRYIFKTVTGKTINDFLTEVRIRKAKEYLSNTMDPVKTIARNVGLDIRSLEKHFKKYTGMTPLDWRQHVNDRLYSGKVGAKKSE